MGGTNVLVDILSEALYDKLREIKIEYERVFKMKCNKPVILRPIAWAFTVACLFGMQWLAMMFCRLGEFLISIAEDFSTIVKILFGATIGTAYIGLYFSSMSFVPAFVVVLSDGIYPTRRAMRFYLAGAYEILGCAFLIIAALMGAVKGGQMFWFYARFALLILQSVFLVAYGKRQAAENAVQEWMN